MVWVGGLNYGNKVAKIGGILSIAISIVLPTYSGLIEVADAVEILCEGKNYQLYTLTFLKK